MCFVNVHLFRFYKECPQVGYSTDICVCVCVSGATQHGEQCGEATHHPCRKSADLAM